jgi:hypothetical protein
MRRGCCGDLDGWVCIEYIICGTRPSGLRTLQMKVYDFTTIQCLCLYWFRVLVLVAHLSVT